jgi:RNA recognition motif-containing protein
VGKKLYVGNLTYRVNDSELEQLFSQFGTVQSVQVIQDRDTGRSKGFGFVEMDTDAQAQAAIEGLHNREHDGRRLTVNEAKLREDRGGGGGGYGGGRSRGGGGRRYGPSAAAFHKRTFDLQAESASGRRDMVCNPPRHCSRACRIVACID